MKNTAHLRRGCNRALPPAGRAGFHPGLHRILVPSLAVFIVLASWSAFAQPPALINYQGRLVDGTNLVNGTVGLSLRLYDAAAGGSVLYEDSNAVTVVDGLYATLLGDNTTEGALDSAIENTNLFLEVAVNGVAMSPREHVAAVPYALLAGNVPDGAITQNKIASGSVGTDQIAFRAITSDQLALDAISGDAIGSYQVGSANLRLAEGSSGGYLIRTNVPNPSAVAGDRFGWSLLVDNQSFNKPLFVGAPRADLGAAGAGVVWKFQDSGSGYNFSTNAGLNPAFAITNPTPSVGAEFGFSMALRGGSFNAGHVIGAPGGETGIVFQNSGKVHVYQSFGGYIGEVVNPSPAAGDRFGHAVANGPDRGFLVGAPFDDAAGTDAGIAYFFDNDQNLVTVFTNVLPGEVDLFGSSLLAADTNMFLVGAPFADAGAVDAGRVSLFYRSGGIMGFITSPAPRIGGRFGAAMAVVGNGLIAIGEPGKGTNGIVYVFHPDGTPAYSLNAPFFSAETNGFGQVIAPLGPGMIAVGAPQQDFLEADQGVAHLYNTAGEDILFAVITSATGGAQAGTALLALDNRTLLVGAPFADVNGQTDAGTLGIISVDTYMPGLFAEGVRNGAVGLEQLNLTQTDGRYVKKAGDTMSGNLALSGADLIVFSGGKAGIGATAPDADLHVRRGSAGLSPNSSALIAVENNTNAFIHLIVPTNAVSGILFGNPDSSLSASMRYNQNGGDELTFRTANARRLTIQSNGFIAVGAITATNLLQVNNAYCDGSTWVNSSDRNLKHDFAPVDGAAILERVVGLPLAEWSYRDDARHARHLGPTAQDFHAAFGLGDNNGSISTIDPSGVALAAIQALAKENEEMRRENEGLRARLKAIEIRLGL